MDEKGYPAWQYSEFTKVGREGQIVVRAETADELVKAILEMDKVKQALHGQTVTVDVSSTKTVSTASSLPKDEQDEINDVLKEEHEPVEDVEICPIHNVAMKPREGKFGRFYSHGEKQDDGSWKNCNGRGYK